MSELPRAILGDLVVHQKGFPFKSRDYQDSGVPVVRVSNFTNDSIDISDLKYISSKVANENQKATLRKDDVIIATVGSWPKNPASIVGKTISVPLEMDGALMNQNSVILRVKSESEVDQKYLFIALKTKLFSEYLVSTAQGSANQASVKLSDIFSYEVEWPDKAVRESIVSIIDSMNQKIELNRQTNQTLEQIAQAIFKSWFVDFEPVKAKINVKQKGGNELAQSLAAEAIICGAITLEQLQNLEESDLGLEHTLHPLVTKKFPQQAGLDFWQPEQLKNTANLFPNVLVESELGEVPEGWGYSEIGNEVTVVGGGTPSTKIPEFWDAGHIHWTTPKDMSNLTDKILLETDRKITEAGLAKISSGLLPVNTVLMSSRAPVGYLAIAKVPVAINQGYIAMKCESDLSPEYIVQWAESVMDEIKQRASGTTFAEISKKNFKVIPVVVPSGKVIEEYTKVVSTLYEKITESLNETRSLTDLRNTLLPKLLSGEIVFGNKQPAVERIA